MKEERTMTTSDRVQVAVAAVCAALALLLVALPYDWIETVVGFEPDGGNGALEALLPTALGLVAVVLVLRVARARRARAARARLL
jgi:hypothetical protein